jgi:hypothetical protein
MEENELFGETHEQEENRLFGRIHQAEQLNLCGKEVAENIAEMYRRGKEIIESTKLR